LATLDLFLTELPATTTTTAAYLVFCDGEQAVTLEKDFNSAVMQSASDFIVLTNHDRAQELGSGERRPSHVESSHEGKLTNILDKIALSGIVAESTARKRCVTKLWEGTAKSDFSRKRTMNGEEAITQNKVSDWLNTYPVTNALTHYAVLMDPKAGEIVWVKHYSDPRALWDRLIHQDQGK